MTSSYRVSKPKQQAYQQTEIFNPLSTGTSFPSWPMPSNGHQQVFRYPLGNKNDEALILESSLTRDSPSEHQDTYDHIQTWNLRKTKNMDSHLLDHNLDFRQNTRSQHYINEDQQIHAKHENYISNYSNQPYHHLQPRNFQLSESLANHPIDSPKHVLELSTTQRKVTLFERSEKINKQLLHFFHTCLWKPQNMTLNLFQTVSQSKVEEKIFQETQIGNKNEQKPQNFWQRSTTENSQISFQNCKKKAKQSIIENKKFFKQSQWTKLMVILQDVILKNNNAAKRLWNFINSFTGNKKLKKGKRIFKILNSLGLQEVYDELIEQENEQKMKRKQKSNFTKSLIFDLVKKI